MKHPFKVSSPPERPLLFFDKECSFCRFWVQRWQHTVGERAEFQPYQFPQARKRFPEIPPYVFERSIQLVEPDGSVYHGSEAVFRVLALSPKKTRLLSLYQKLPGFAPFTEWLYRVVSSNRKIFSAINQFFFGEKEQKKSRVEAH